MGRNKKESRKRKNLVKKSKVKLFDLMARMVMKPESTVPNNRKINNEKFVKLFRKAVKVFHRREIKCP